MHPSSDARSVRASARHLCHLGDLGSGQCSRAGELASGGSVSLALWGFSGASSGSINLLKDVELDEVPRVKSGNSELDLVLGGGFVPGSCVLLGGEPGAGKSTILLQTLCHMAQNETALYVTGEESSQQVAMRARRLDLPLDKLQIMTETSVENICLVAKGKTPRLLVVDSIQVVHLEDITSAPGSVSQVRESAAALVRFAKQTNTILIIVGHVTKDGTLAGPKVLEHMLSLIHI